MKWLQWVFQHRLKRLQTRLGYLEQKTPFWRPWLFLLPGLAIMGFFVIYPLFITLDFAFHPLENPHKANSGVLGLGEFISLFEDAYFTKAISNSIIYAFITIPVSIVIALVIATLITSLTQKFLRGTWQTIFFLPYVTSGVAISLAFAYLFDNDTGLINKLFGLQENWLENAKAGDNHALIVMIIHGVWTSLAFQILIFTVAMLGVDRQRYKAAAIDGASGIKQFFVITIPSISKTISFAITIGLIGAIKVFPLALFGMDPIKAEQYGGSTLMLFVFKNLVEGHYQAASAAAIILILVAIGFNLVVKNTFNLITQLIIRGGQWRVQAKIKTLT